jgi:hypothetical protein
MDNYMGNTLKFFTSVPNCNEELKWYGSSNHPPYLNSLCSGNSWDANRSPISHRESWAILKRNLTCSGKNARILKLMSKIWLTTRILKHFTLNSEYRIRAVHWAPSKKNDDQFRNKNPSWTYRLSLEPNKVQSNII